MEDERRSVARIRKAAVKVTTRRNYCVNMVDMAKVGIERKTGGRKVRDSHITEGKSTFEGLAFDIDVNEERSIVTLDMSESFEVKHCYLHCSNIIYMNDNLLSIFLRISTDSNAPCTF